MLKWLNDKRQNTAKWGGESTAIKIIHHIRDLQKDSGYEYWKGVGGGCQEKKYPSNIDNLDALVSELARVIKEVIDYPAYQQLDNKDGQKDSIRKKVAEKLNSYLNTLPSGEIFYHMGRKFETPRDGNSEGNFT